MPRRRFLALPSIALATIEPALTAAELGPLPPPGHGDLHPHRHTKSSDIPTAAISILQQQHQQEEQQHQRKATLCDSECSDDPTYESKIGLACSGHRQFQCPMFLILGYNEDETAELLRRCPCTCGVDCADKNANNGATSDINTIISTPMELPKLTNTLQPTTTPTVQPTSYPTEFPTIRPSTLVPMTSTLSALHNEAEPKEAGATLSPGLTPSSSGGSGNTPFIIIGDQTIETQAEVGDLGANEIMGTVQHTEEQQNMVLTTKELIIICAGIAGLAFLTGIVFQLSRGRSNSGKKEQQNSKDEDFVIEVGHDGHRHRKFGGGCSTTACSSDMASEVQYFTYINRTVKNNRTVLAFEKNSSAWSKRLPFTKSFKDSYNEEKERGKEAVDPVDIETGGQAEVESATKHIEDSYGDCEGPIPVIFSHDEDKATQPSPTTLATKAESKRNTISDNERRGKEAVSRRSGHNKNRDKGRRPEDDIHGDDASELSQERTSRISSQRRSRSHRATYSRDRREHERYHHERRRDLGGKRSGRESRSKRYRGRAGDCGLAGLGQCFDAEHFDSYDTYDDFSALGRDMHLIKAKTTETYGSYGHGEERDGTFDTFDQESLPSQRGSYDEGEADLTLSATRRRLENNGGAWGKMLNRSPKDDDK